MQRTILQIIEKFLTETAMPPTLFGRLSVRDPRFVFDLRRGRQPGARVKSRIEHFMNKWRTHLAADGGSNRAGPTI